MGRVRRKARKLCILAAIILIIMFLRYNLPWDYHLPAKHKAIRSNTKPATFEKEPAPYLEQFRSDLERTLWKFNQSKRIFFGRPNAIPLGPTGGQRSGQVPMSPQCAGDLFLLIEIHSKPERILWREAIRLSWGRQENDANRGIWQTNGR